MHQPPICGYTGKKKNLGKGRSTQPLSAVTITIRFQLNNLRIIYNTESLTFAREKFELLIVIQINCWGWKSQILTVPWKLVTNSTFCEWPAATKYQIKKYKSIICKKKQEIYKNCTGY